MGFTIGFVGSLATFLIIAHKKDKEREEKKRASSFDVNIVSQELPVKSRIYFLNYKYHF